MNTIQCRGVDKKGIRCLVMFATEETLSPNAQYTCIKHTKKFAVSDSHRQPAFGERLSDRREVLIDEKNLDEEGKPQADRGRVLSREESDE